jgi:hypothetical protein
VRPPLKFAEGDPPETVLARPEGWMADRTCRDNLIELLRTAKTPVAIASLGTTPSSIPEAGAGGLDGWQIKQRATPRTLAFWLNQGAPFVLIHSAYESSGAEMQHCMLPSGINPSTFRWQDAPPLVTLRSFCDGLAGATPISTLTGLRFRYVIDPDPVFIPASGDSDPLRASDAVALLTFQIDERHFAVAAYVVSPNVTKLVPPSKMVLNIDRRVTDAGVSTLRPYTRAAGAADILNRADDSTTVRFDVYDDVTWLRFEIE